MPGKVKSISCILTIINFLTSAISKRQKVPLVFPIIIENFSLYLVPVLDMPLMCSFIRKAMLFYSSFPSLVFNPARVPRGIKFIFLGLHFFFCVDLYHFLFCPIVRINHGFLLTSGVTALPSLNS